ncbi:hypothetical protein M434DRAFT_26664 [Hypoxylon sp. CO27-5]|nr:hypothetical protein M434DRAFT_26664 [Hypoxylon sp. CO27-5]
MQILTLVATALLPLLAVAETSTTTSTLTMTKYITIQRVATSSVYSANSTSVYPTGTGSSSFVAATTTTGADGTPTTVAPTVSPSIDNQNAGAALGSAHVALAGLAGVVVAALIVWSRCAKSLGWVDGLAREIENYSIFSPAATLWFRKPTHDTHNAVEYIGRLGKEGPKGDPKGACAAVVEERARSMFL